MEGDDMEQPPWAGPSNNGSVRFCLPRRQVADLPGGRVTSVEGVMQVGDVYIAWCESPGPSSSADRIFPDQTHEMATVVSKRTYVKCPAGEL